jgi:predicted ATPase/class 3 adenylate cyclase
MGPAPGATVTFLFTDIEGSTRLWQEHPETMPDALARHDALVREAIERHGGRLFKHTGDGVCAAFVDAPAAFGAAVALQRALADASWGAGPRLHVRVALDSGPAHERDADYFGPTLNRAARVLASGAGGQIVATAATLRLAPDTEHVDLGLHRLRDLGEPVHLHQVTAAGLERAFPPLRTLERFRHSLPVVRSSFVGREAEIARLRDLLATRRLVTVTGVGGCGKTRLALAAAALELERFEDGVYFVDFSILSEPSLVWGAMAGALRVVDAGGPSASVPPRELVLGRLSAAAALVVLDNCEHLLEACAEVTDALVGRCPAVAVMTTSREPLGVEGEQILRVPSLGLPAGDADAIGSEAVRLFVERAAAADAGFTLTPAIAPTLVKICRRLDGIPLAIELAAARVRHLSLDEIARRLDDRFRLLTGGPRGARQRQQTLAAALDWSFQLLTDRERTLLRRCAVFVDGFSLAGAEGVCAGDDLDRADIVDVLGALVDKSLVSLHATEHRYRLLETIRLYAEERLIEAGEAQDVRTRHMAWFEHAYDTPRGETTPYRLAERENLKAARVWAHEMHDGARVARICRALFRQSGPYDPTTLEERVWGETALEYQDLADDVRADMLAIASMRAIAAGDWNGAIERARAAIALAAHPGDGLSAASYMALAIALMVTDPDAAERTIDEGIERIQQARAPFFSAGLLRSLKVGTALMRGDAARAAERGRQTIAELGRALRGFGLPFALHLLGDHDGAEADAALDAPEGLEIVFGGHSRNLLFALTAAARGRFDDARRELGAAVTAVRRYDYPLTLNDCVVVAGAIAALEGRLERACILLAAVADRSFVRTPEMWAVYLHYRSIVRAGLDAATIRRCRAEAGSLVLYRALDEEIARSI